MLYKNPPRLPDPVTITKLPHRSLTHASLRLADPQPLPPVRTCTRRPDDHKSTAAAAEPAREAQLPQANGRSSPRRRPHKVWVNTSTKVYHCYGDRYYGKTANGKYMTEAEAKALGAKGSRGETCKK